MVGVCEVAIAPMMRGHVASPEKVADTLRGGFAHNIDLAQKRTDRWSPPHFHGEPVRYEGS